MFRLTIPLRLFAGCLMLTPWSMPAAETKRLPAVSVNSQAEKSYQRERNPDGTLKPEYYVISWGGRAEGTTTDRTVDYVRAAEFMGLLRQHLAGQNYLLAPGLESADLLLHLFWGLTVPFSDGNAPNYTSAVGEASQAASVLSTAGAGGAGGFMSQDMSQDNRTQENRADEAATVAQLENSMIVLMDANRVRDRANGFNASLLGYHDEMLDWNGRAGAAGVQRLDDLRADIEEPRYYILVYAYDVRSLAEKKERRLRWVTRISIRAFDNRFDENLAGMISRAAPYFGQDSNGLRERSVGTVKLADPKFLGVVSDEEAATKEAPAPKENSDPAGKPGRRQP